MSKRIFRLGALLALGLLMVAGAGPAQAQQGFVPPGFERAAAAQEFHTDRLMEIDGVVGTGVGLGPRGEPAVVIMTQDLGVRGLPRRLDGVTVVVKVTGRFLANPKPDCSVDPSHPSCGGDGGDDTSGGVDPTGFFARPVPIGVSVGNANSCSAGTIGLRLVDNSGQVYALSNNHVFALENTAVVGQDIHQPGLYDTGCEADGNNDIGDLEGFVPLDFSGDNTVDAAIASTDIGSLGTNPPEGYTTNCTGPVDATLGEAVQKYGRTTGHTTGSVAAVNATVNVGYTGGTATFIGQIVVEGNKGGFLKSGDSGSSLVDMAGCPVGLLFASGRGGKIAIANDIDDVIGAFSANYPGLSVDRRPNP